jgi:nucleotide-binding universal stress UspA family protein
VYDQILFPTDGSDGTARAAEHAVSLARTNGATLHVLHVLDTSALTLDSHSRELVDAMESAGRGSVAAVCDRAIDAGVHAVDVVRRGTPHREILDYAAENDVDLIVIGTHGRTGLSRRVLGSVTERVVRLSDAPVLTVRTLPAERE